MNGALKLREALSASISLDSIEAEHALLGAVLFRNDALAMGADMVTGEMFSDHLSGWLFDRCREMIARKELADPVSLDRIAHAYGTLYEEVCGRKGLVRLMVDAPPAENAADYARIVLDGHVRRQAARICQEGIASLLTDQSANASSLAGDVRDRLERVEREGAPEDRGAIEAGDAADQAIQRMREYASAGKPRGLMTGLRCIDRRLNGLKGGALVVVGGRPAMGKTSLVRAALHGAAVRNPDRRFLLLGIEMGPEEMIQRELSAISHEQGSAVEYRAMGAASLTPYDFQAIDQARQAVPRNLTLVDCPALSVEDVRRRIWAASRKGKLGAVAIDYLQLMRRPDAKGRNEASVLGEMTQALKQAARTANVAIVLVSQLSRAVEGRDDKRPQLSDLRESGAIEQDADAVLFPFREYYYLIKAEPKERNSDRYTEWEIRCADLHRRLEVICAKNRQGPEGVDRQRYFAEFDFIEDDN